VAAAHLVLVRELRRAAGEQLRERLPRRLERVRVPYEQPVVKVVAKLQRILHRAMKGNVSQKILFKT
jgi:hypothetical protein